MRTRRARILLAALGLAIAGLAAIHGVDELPAAPAADVPFFSPAPADGTLRITEHVTGGGRVSFFVIAGFLVGAGLLAFAAWPRRPEDPSSSSTR